MTSRKFKIEGGEELCDNSCSSKDDLCLGIRLLIHEFCLIYQKRLKGVQIPSNQKQIYNSSLQSLLHLLLTSHPLPFPNSSTFKFSPLSWPYSTKYFSFFFFQTKDKIKKTWTKFYIFSLHANIKTCLVWPTNCAGLTIVKNLEESFHKEE